MGATMRRLVRTLLVVTMLAGFGAAVAATAAPAAAYPGASSATPPVPTSTIRSAGNTTVVYCVSNYQPNSVVTVKNQENGATGTIHTNANGSGCTTVRVDRKCDATVSQTIVASGYNVNGKPASSQATYVASPSTAKACRDLTPTPSPTTTCKPTEAILSVYRLLEGALLRGHACGFRAGETVYGYMHSTPTFLGSTTAASDGVAEMRVRLPACVEPGQHTFILIGQSSGDVATAQFTVTGKAPGCNPQIAASAGLVGPVSANGGGGGGGGGGTLAFTGADILAMVLVGLLLLVIGAVLLTVRRRRTASV